MLSCNPPLRLLPSLLLLDRATGSASATDVSILIQPEGWMLRAESLARGSGAGSFNPHPTRRLDATQNMGQNREHRARFNPHPTRRLDATAPSPSCCSAWGFFLAHANQ